MSDTASKRAAMIERLEARFSLAREIEQPVMEFLIMAALDEARSN